MALSRVPLPLVLVVIAAVCAGGLQAQERTAAATPPMGWNSWDSYAESVKEGDIRANAEWMAKNLKAYGWEYVIVDMGWYVTNHSAGISAQNAQFSMDQYGRYTPAENSYGSAVHGAGFRPLADYVHGLGLKFGIHILRGIPKEAVEKNLAIQGSEFHARDAADTSDTCLWNPYNYGVDTKKAAGQAYYDSLARQYAEWQVDYVKVDCIASHPYKGDEIRSLSEALKKSGRPMVLSLSPGPAPIEKAEEMGQYANLWRISNDEWDVWQSNEEFPQGINNQFERVAQWAPHVRPGNWPDADMLAIGQLGPTPGWGEPRMTRLTEDEQRTLLTLWAMFRSPLMMGGNLTQCDEWTKSLLTNAEVIAVDQHSKGNRSVETTVKAAVWAAEREGGDGYYVAVFNRLETPQSLHYEWKQLGLNARAYSLRDLWEHKDAGRETSLDVKLPAHASVLYFAQADGKR
ncbi:MAG TPA: glycoside hydrolase family 27 protein [Candidatus Eremiobacteraceae bacterium]|nr:glycoside hydrolase family 27 protein [Candidatus Eremiobacteraceae bacterium]